MTTAPRFSAVLFLLIASSAAAQLVDFTVSETAGLRRFGYPVTVSVECPRGVIQGPDQVQLTDTNGNEVPAQFTPMSRWPDDSVRGLDIDFAPSPGPLETATYRVKFGTGPSRPLRRGLEVTESLDEVIVESAAIRHVIRRDGKPLLSSIAFGSNEFVAAGGIRTTLRPGPVEVVKRGPVNVTLNLGPVRLEYVNSKSWVKITQIAEAPRDLGVDAHFQLTDSPLLWDFGAGSWLYGNLSKKGETVSLQARGNAWEILTGNNSLFAVAPSFDGCGHLANGKKAAAFGIINAAHDTKISLSPEGRVTISAHRSVLITYFHVVGQPVPVTAVTSPQSMIASLEVRTPPH